MNTLKKSKRNVIPKLGDKVTFRTGVNMDKETMEFTVTGVFSTLKDLKKNIATLYCDFKGNQGDVFEFDTTELYSINGEKI